MIIDSYKIVNEHNKQVLYIFLNRFNSEFAQEVEMIDASNNTINLETTIDEYLKENNIKFDGDTIKVMLGNVILNTISNEPENELDNIYIVKSDDTLVKIAELYDCSVNDITYLNKLKSIEIYPGMALKIPANNYSDVADDSSGYYYIVKLGDSLSHIAIKYGVSLIELSSINHLDSHDVHVGQKLLIPKKHRELIEYLVKDELSIAYIALIHGVTTTELKLWNNIDVNYVEKDTRLKIYVDVNTPNKIGGYDLSSNITIKIYRNEYSTIENVDLEEYVLGVIANEIPANFHMETLKTQAIIARTNVMNLLYTNPLNIISDTNDGQIYCDLEDLQWLWKDYYTLNIKKYAQAVFDTKGQIIKYNRTPVEAPYFSTSNGYTQNAEDFWISMVPYLKSVDSHWDFQSPFFKREKIIPVEYINSLLDINITSQDDIGEVWMTEKNYVKKIELDKRHFTGKFLMEKFNLNTTSFTLTYQNDNIKFNLFGFGNGIGLSQYGANGMAYDGFKYDEIINHFYKSTLIEKI